MRVRFPNGPDQIEGELVLPPTEGSHPGIVLIPDVGGLSELYVGFAQQMAQAGFAALALNPYSRGEQPDLSNLEAILKFLAELPDRQVLSDVQAALDYLAARPETRGRRLGVTGFCVGGQYTILAGCSLRGLSAAVAWYGMLRVSRIDECNPEHPLDALPLLGCPLLGLFGEDDAIVPRADVEELGRRTAGSACAVETVVYPGAGHAFANSGRPDAYRPEAARDAWERMLAFFHRHCDA